MTSNDTPAHLAVVAVVHNRHILLGRRRDTGKWTTPGGHVQPGETPTDAAVRELHEETGIQAHPTALLPLRTTEVSPGLTVHGFYHALPERPPTTMQADPDEEVHRWHWVPLHALPADEDMAVPSDRHVILQALAGKFPDPSIRYAEGGNPMADMTAEARDSLKASDFAVPGKRKLPLGDEKHIKLAWDMVDRTDGLSDEEKATARKRILAAAKKHDIDTSDWTKKEMTDTVVAEVEVLTDAAAPGPMRLRWRGTRANVVNDNMRMYPHPILADGVVRAVAKYVKPGKMVGESPHPKAIKAASGKIVFDTSLHNSVIKITDLRMSGSEVILDTTVLDTAKGKDLRAAVEAGIPVGISMRALGDTVQRQIDGRTVDVATSLDIQSFDVVMNPATDSCGVIAVLTDSQVSTLLEPAPEEAVVDDIEPASTCPSCGGQLQEMDPDNDGDVDFYACTACNDAYVSDCDVQQTTVARHTLSKVTPGNWDACGLAREWLAKNGTMTDSINIQINTADTASRKVATMENTTVTDNTEAIAAAAKAAEQKFEQRLTDAMKPFNDHIEAQKAVAQADANAKAAKTEASAFLDDKLGVLKDKYDEKTIAIIRDSIGDPPNKEQAEASFDAAVRLVSKANASAFLDGHGVDLTKQARGHVRVEVGQEARPWMATVQKIMDACDDHGKQQGKSVDESLRKYNRENVLNKVATNEYHPETYGKSLVDWVCERAGMENLSQNARSLTDAIECSKVLSDSIGITTTNLLNQPTISTAVLFQMFQDVESLQFLTPEIFRGSELRIPLETFQSGAVYNGTTLMQDLLVGEGIGIPSSAVTLAYQSFSPSWRKNAVSLSKEVVRQLQSGPVNYPAIARAIYNVTEDKRRKLDLLAYQEMFTASDAYGALTVTNETPSAANLVTATGLPAGTNAAYLYKLVPGTSNYQAPTITSGVAYGGNPVVRPRTVNTIGATGAVTATTSYSFTIANVNSVVQVQGAWDGTNIVSFPGTTATFAVDYEHGIIYFKATGTSGVNPGAGTPILPTMSYYASQNFDRWVTALGAGYTDIAAWYDTLLQQLTKTSALMGSSPRFRRPNLAIMSLTAASYIENARIFYKFAQPDGTQLLNTGNTFGQRAGMNLSRINAPWVAGDGRILLTSRGSTRYGIETPYDMEGPFPVYDSSQNIIDAKVWYGSENSVMATPVVQDSNGVVYNPPNRSVILQPS